MIKRTKNIHRLIASVMTLLMLTTFLNSYTDNSNNNITAKALSNDEITAKLTELQATYPSGSYWVGTDVLKYGGYQCYAFARQLAVDVFGSYPAKNVAYATEGEKSNGWTAIRNASNVTLEPGDIIRADNNSHTCMIWKVEGSNVYVGQCWGSSDDKINWGAFWGNNKKATISELLDSGFTGVWKHPGGATITSALTSSNNMNIDDNGIAFICAREGFHSTCYSDGSQSSIGYGTKCTGSSEQPHASGSHTITKEAAMEEMRKEINNTYAQRVRTQTAGLSLTQSQFNALVSLCYNCGGGTSLISNSPLVKYLKGELTESEARSQYSNYIVYSGNTRLQGLVNRRNAEADLFFSDVPTDLTITGQTIPTGTLTPGRFFAIKGLVKDSVKIKKIYGGVYYRNGGPVTGAYAEAKPDTYTYDLSSYFDSKIIFNNIPTGYYTYCITVEDEKGTHPLIKSDFQIGNPKEWYEDLKPADLGANLDGIILNKNYWKPIRSDSTSNVVLHSEEWTNTEMWRFTRQSDGSYKIVNFGDGLCLDAYGLGTTAGTRIGTYQSNDTAAQRWFIYEMNGGYVFRPIYCSLVMDLYGNYKDDNTQIQLYNYHGGNAQVFSIYTNGVKDYAKPSPKAPSLSVKSYSSISLSWERTAYTDRYIVYRSTDNSTWKKLAETQSASYTDSGLSAQTKYYYKYESVSRYYASASPVSSATTSSIPKVTITLDANGGKISKTSFSVNTGGKLTELDNISATKEGLIFSGWYSDKSGGNRITASYSVTKNMTLYAHWQPKTITVTFYRNINASDTSKVTETFTYAVANQKFGYKTDGTGRYSKMNDASVGFGEWTYTDHTLLGWSTKRDATSRSYSTYSGVSNDWINQNAPSISLYAVWTPNPATTTTTKVTSTTTKATTASTTTAVQTTSTTTTTAATTSIPLTLEKTEITLAMGEQYTVQANQSNLKYASSDPSVAVVSKSSGIITAIEEGEALVSAIDTEGNVVQIRVIVTPALKPTVYGDANNDGKVTVADAVAILQYIGNKDKYNLSEQGKKNADVDGVAGITAKDALIIQQVDSGYVKLERLPII